MTARWLNAYQIRCAREMGHGATSITWERRPRQAGAFLYIERPAVEDAPAYVDVYYVPTDHKIAPTFVRSFWK